jgi:hypothetical protein
VRPSAREEFARRQKSALAERAVRDEQLTEEDFRALLLSLLPAGKLLLSLDRTTWERGKAPFNLLVLGVVLHDYTLPLVWTALPHDGNFLGRTAPMRTLARSHTRFAWSWSSVSLEGPGG